MKRRFWAIGITIVALAMGAVGCQTDGTGSADADPSDGQISGQIGESEFNQGSGGANSHSTAIGDLQTVYFDYDQSTIRNDAATALRANADVIKQNASWGQVTINGNTDERGSEEYNLALGERRANAVRRYLVDLGVSSGRLRTVSFGEAKPAIPGHQESAYQYNRRAEFTN